MTDGPKDIECPSLTIKHCSTEAHCEALARARNLPFWWYQDTTRFGRNFSLPFRDSLGDWWYQVRPGFAWPVDVFDPLTGQGRQLPWRNTYVAYQHVVPEDEPSNAALVFNTISDVAQYGSGSMDDKRRNAVRKGMRSCDVQTVERLDDGWLPGVTQAWNDLVDRTGWKHHRDASQIRESWSELIELSSATILLAIDKESGQVAGFLITKAFGRTAYVDTIASNSGLLKSNPNDALMYTFLRNVQKVANVQKVHYALKSNVESLEKFKTSLGFQPLRFPARLHARPGVMTALRLLRPTAYRRVIGDV